jgi:hypothetical protein
MGLSRSLLRLWAFLRSIVDLAATPPGGLTDRDARQQEKAARLLDLLAA